MGQYEENRFGVLTGSKVYDILQLHFLFLSSEKPRNVEW